MWQAFHKDEFEYHRHSNNDINHALMPLFQHTTYGHKVPVGRSESQEETSLKASLEGIIKRLLTGRSRSLQNFYKANIRSFSADMLPGYKCT
jgi:hypothetical protein